MNARGKRGYHHGNLKAALSAAARALISEKGPLGVTIAEAARRAGVSPSAPYRHFRDREALLAAIAREGFETFAARLSAAWSDPALTPLQAFDAVGRAYLAFAREEPAFFAAMFEAGLAFDQDPELVRAGEAAFDVLRRACETLIAPLPPDRRPPVEMVARHVWATSHGVAALFGRADGTARPSPIVAEELLESAIGVYLRGLGVIPNEPAAAPGL